jgi:hypothetical protein
MNPFDFVNAINITKKDLIRGSDNPALIEKEYNSFVVNRALSYFSDTVMYANVINQLNSMDAILKNDYYINSIRCGKRFSKWHKKQANEPMDVIQEYYNVNYIRALEISKLLSKEQIDLIRIRITKGGNYVRSESDGGGVP